MPAKNTASIDRATLTRLGGDADAVLLLLRASFKPGATAGATIPLSATREAAALGWTLVRYRAARTRLERAGLLQMVETGGAGQGAANLYRLPPAPTVHSQAAAH